MRGLLWGAKGTPCKSLGIQVDKDFPLTAATIIREAGREPGKSDWF